MLALTFTHTNLIGKTNIWKEEVFCGVGSGGLVYMDVRQNAKKTDLHQAFKLIKFVKNN